MAIDLKTFCKGLGAAAWLLAAGTACAAEPGPGTTATAIAVPTVAAAPVPVLCYHRFGPYPETDPYFVTAEEFKHQLEIIREAGFSPVTSDDYEAAREGRKALPAKPILITIDDGYRDVVVHALPILKSFGFPATVFAYPGFINSRHGLTPEQLRQLKAEGWSIGSHSYTHPKLTRPDPGETPEKYAQRLKQELEGSRLKLEEWLGTTVTALAYPYGLWNPEVAAAARTAGYRIMYTVDQGVNVDATPGDQLKRIMIQHGVKDSTFRFLLADEPLTLVARDPEPGRGGAGPLTRLSATIAPELLAQLDPKSIRVLFGGVPAAVTLEAGRAEIVLAKPWTHGTNAVMMVAKDAAHRRHFKECWLVQVEKTGR